MDGGFEDPVEGFESTVIGFDMGAPVHTRRGLFMGLTLPYGGVTSDYLAIAARGNLAWLRCGFPEIKNMLSTPSNAGDAGTLALSELADEVAAAHGANRGYIFSMLGVPREVNDDAGHVTAGNPSGSWKLYPTDSAGRAQMAGYAAQIATVLMDSYRATGVPVMFECYQEPNIPAFNPMAQSATVVALAMAEVHLAVRAAEPDLPIMAGSIANRGGIVNTNPGDVGWTGPSFLAAMLTADARLKTTAAPDYWGYHPYTGNSDPADLTNQYAMGQMVNFGATLLLSGAEKPDGSPAQVSVTEYGPFRVRTFNVQSQSGRLINASDGRFVDSDEGKTITGTNIPGGTTIEARITATQVRLTVTPTGTVTAATVTNDDQQYDRLLKTFQTFDTFRSQGWVAGPELYYEEIADEKSIYRSSGPHDPWPAGVLFEYFALYEPPVIEPPPPPPPVVIPPPVLKLELGIRPRADSGPWRVLAHAVRGRLGSTYQLPPAFIFYDVTQWVEAASIRMTRGRNQERGAIEPGTLEATFDNQDRRFDKRNRLGPYWPHLRPPKVRLRLSIDGVLQITTIVDELLPSYYNVVEATASFDGADGLSRLARTDVEFTAKQQPTQGRLNMILDIAKWPRAKRYIAPGAFMLGAYPVAAKALDEINTIAETEDTLIFCNADNVFVFVPRAALSNPPVLTFTDTPDPDEPLDVDYKEIHYSDGSATFANQVSVTRRAKDQSDNPVPQGYSDWDSVSEYGPVTRDITDSPVADDGNAVFQAIMIGTTYSTPADHIDAVTLDLADFPPETRTALLTLEIGSPVRVVHHPPGGGDPATNDQHSVIVGKQLTVGGVGVATSFEMTWYLHAVDGGI